MWTSLSAWYRPSTAQGRLGLQATINSGMLWVVMALHPWPWLALAAMLALFAATAWTHGRGSLLLLAAYGALGWIGEAWIVGFGQVWRFATPTVTGVDGGLFGVPFFMAPVWSLTGALMLALAGFLKFKPRGE
jgi:hypothetical protein